MPETNILVVLGLLYYSFVILTSESLASEIVGGIYYIIFD